jgi:hypothetical protein
MSHILFGNTIDMLILATPSTGYAIAYDLDNTLKQKDSNGDLSPIGGSQNLSTVLKYGNNSGTYSITLGTYSEINSLLGGRILLSESATQSILLDVKSITSTSSISLKPSGITLFNKSLTNNNTFLFSDNSYSLVTATESNGYIVSTNVENTYNNWSLKFRDNSFLNEFLNVIYSENISDGNDSLVKASLHLNSSNSITQFGVYNSVIIGGDGLNATESNTVYLGNNVNINNSYKLPISDGSANQIIKTDGLGNLTWLDLNSLSPGLESVLNISNYTGDNNIEIGFGNSIKSFTSSSSLTFDKNLSLNNISISNSNSEINLTPTDGIIISTVDGQGLIYADNYKSNFVSESLVSKRYVDDLVSILNIDIHYEGSIVYVDPLYGDNNTGLLFRRDLPYLSIASASESISINGGLVYIKAGKYSEMCVLTDGLKYYCEPGVVFETGGFTDFNLTVNCDIYGYAKFIGDSILLKPFTVNNESNINFEFDEINITNSYQAIVINNSSSVNIRGNNINSVGVRTLHIKGSGNNNINIKGDIIGKNNSVYFENFSGSCIINSNNIITKNSIYEASNLYGVSTNNGVSGKITINSNIKNLGTYTTTTKTNSALRVSSGYFIINGDITGGVEYSVIITGSSLGNVTINGNLYSSVENLHNDSTSINLKLNSSQIITSGLSTAYAIILNNTSDTYFNNCNIVNLTTNSNLILVSNSNSKVTLYNTNGFSNGTSGYFIDTNQNLNVGIHNTRSNKDNNLLVNDLFEPSGFIYDNNFYLPTF